MSGSGRAWISRRLRLRASWVVGFVLLGMASIVAYDRFAAMDPDPAAAAKPSASAAIAAAAPPAEQVALPSWGPASEPPNYRVPVTRYGAKGDGKTDDTAAIQAAVDAVGKKGGGTVYFPDGVYSVSSSIVVGRDLVWLEGESWNAEVRMTKHPKRVIVIQGSRDNAVRNLRISLGVAGASRHDEDEGIYVTGGASRFLIDHVLGDGKGIMVRGDAGQGTIRNNTIRNTLADGIHLTGRSAYIAVSGNELDHTGDDSIAVVSYENDQGTTRFVTISNNVIRRSQARGIAHVGGYQVEIAGNRIEGTSSSGILVDKDPNVRTYAAIDTVIRENTVKGAGTYGGKKGNQFGLEVSPGGAGNVLISDNNVTGSASRGISVSARNAEILRNVSSENGDSGLQVDASGCRIIGNMFERNGTFGFYAADSDRLTIEGNRLADNNVRNLANIDNFVLKNSDSSIVKGNASVETRQTAQLERAFELTGSCRDTAFENNRGEGTRLGTVMECTP